jgi:hypothetical protein
MFTATLYNFKIQENELHRQAAEYRLMKSLEQPNKRIVRMYEAIGQVLILTGEQLIHRTKAAH